jgi:hypothetical protein
MGSLRTTSKHYEFRFEQLETKTGSKNSPPIALPSFTEFSPISLFDFSQPSDQTPRQSTTAETWPDAYRNASTGKPYTPHSEDERRYVYEDGPRYALAKGGEGGGKSVALIIKTLERLRRGMDGIFGSPDLPHFRRSLWPEFKRWCPWNMVIDQQQRRGNAEWEPSEPFTLTFQNGARLFCGGFEDPTGWEGPNVSFAAIDEARRKKDPLIVKTLDGRVRISGPRGEPPQLFMATTPRKHWLYDMFGPLKTDEPDDYAVMKAKSLVITLLTRDNAANLAEGYVEDRASTLTEAEKRVLLDAEWEDIDTAERFLPSITWWDGCREDLAPLDPFTPIVLAADAGVTNDSFGLIGVSRHPDRREDVAVRFVRVWYPRGKPLDFDVIEAEIRSLCATWNITQVAYDAYQLHQMMTRLQNDGIVWTKAFSQGGDRLIADKQLLDVITQRRLAHDGDVELRTHIDNADRKAGDEAGKLRLVKRTAKGKIDLAVATSMAVARCLELNL